MPNRKFTILFCLLLLPILITTAQTSGWTLQQCVDSALDNNLSIQQSANTMGIVDVDLNQDKANRLPSFNASASETYGSGRSLNPSNYQFVNENIFSNNFSVNGSIPIFNGLHLANKVRQSQLNYQSAKYDLESVKNDLVIAIVNAYLQVLYAQESVKNSQYQVESTAGQVKRLGELVEIGLKPESEVLQLKAQLASDNLLVVKAQGQLKSAKVNLQQQMNIPISPTFDIVYTPIPEHELVPEGNVEDIYSEALSVQPIIKSYQLKSQSAAFGIKLAKSYAYPTLTLKGSLGSTYSSATKYADVSYINSVQQIGYIRNNPTEIVDGVITSPVYNYSNYPFFDQLYDYKNFSFSLLLSIPIFNSTQVRYNVKRQKFSYENSLLNEEKVKTDLRKNIEHAYIEVENAKTSLEATKQQLDATQASYENTKAKYESGIMNIYELLIEKNKYFVATSQFLQAKYEVVFRTKLLDYYKGVPIDL